MAKILVSACLLGCNCRYDGKSCLNENIIALKKKHTLIPVCPEQLGGLETPRSPSERQGDKVIMKTGEDVTAEYMRGAQETLRLANLFNIKKAILKANSPSCGKGIIYDGSFSGQKCSGNGVTAELFMKNGITVCSEEEINFVDTHKKIV
ncbi:MAG: DUF523 domain-containing protein [Oscillospiraceae bacterium]|nr:DUF523 domain-containing protein [Oscillospiraceae bacterium]